MKRREPSPEERLSIREAARLQRGLAWVLGALDEQPPEIPQLSTSDDAEQAGATARLELGIPVAAQLEWESEYEAARRWCEALERSGVYVLFLPMGEQSVQGFSLWDERAPVISVNTTRWKAQARIYTMFHEYGTRTAHTFLLGVRSDGISRDDALRYRDVADADIDELESQVAAG